MRAGAGWVVTTVLETGGGVGESSTFLLLGYGWFWAGLWSLAVRDLEV